MNNQTEYLERVQEINHMPTFVYLETIDPESKKGRPGPRYNIGKYKLVDHRTVGSNEVIWDLDYPGYANNFKIAKEITKVLENRGWGYNVFSTGGKGIHISMWFNKVLFDKDDQLKELFSTSLSYGLSIKKVRIWLWELVLKEANVWNGKTEKDRGLDTNPINFNEEYGKFHAIRCCGGQKIERNNVLNRTETTYKTWIPPDQFKSKKVIVRNIENVLFPTNIDLMDIDRNEFADFLQTFISYAGKHKTPKRENIVLKDASYIELQSVKAIIEGLNEGQRAMGARIIAIASKLDGFNQEKAKILMDEYVENSSQIGSPFNIEEGYHWIEWVYNQPEHFWNCSLVKELGVHDNDTCEYCKQSKKDVYKVLESKGLMKRIDTYLSEKIVGEEKNRMLLFMLLLTNKFHIIEGKEADAKPASVIFSSMSSSGKSYLSKRVLPLFGTKGEDFFIFSRMTSSALNYFAGINMNGKVLFTEELQGLDSTSNQMRVWISEGQLNLSTVEKVRQEDGTEVNQLVIKETEGQPVFLSGTAEDSIDEQMNNRSWLLSLDITEAQNKRVLAFEDKMAQGRVRENVKERRIIRDCIKELKNYRFIIPYYDYKDLNIPTKDVRVRRDYQKLKYIICCSALLHQKQRFTFKDDVTDDEYLVCNFDDYEIAKHYSEEALRATFSGLTNQQIELALQIKNMSWANEFTSENVQRMCGWSQSKTWTMLRQLEETGVITTDGRGEHGRGNVVEYHYNFDKELLDLTLPPAEILMEKFAKRDPKLFLKMAKISVLLLQSHKTTKVSEIRNSLENQIQGVEKLEVHEFDVSSNPAKLFLQTQSKEMVVKSTKSDGSRNSEKTMISTDIAPEIVSRNSLASKEEVLNFIKTSKKHMVDINDMKWDNTDKIIDDLKRDGEIYEIKPGRVMIL